MARRSVKIAEAHLDRGGGYVLARAGRQGVFVSFGRFRETVRLFYALGRVRLLDLDGKRARGWFLRAGTVESYVGWLSSFCPKEEIEVELERLGGPRFRLHAFHPRHGGVDVFFGDPETTARLPYVALVVAREAF